MAGTAHDADTAQLPQSIKPLRGCVRQFGWFCGSVAVGVTVRDLARAMPAVVAHPIDVEAVVRRVGVDLERYGRARG